MTVLDTGSVDGTRELLASLVAEGLPIDLRDDDDPDYQQARRTTAMMRDAVARHAADWVLPLDADEFPRGLERDALPLDASRPIRIPWMTYVPTASDDAADP